MRYVIYAAGALGLLTLLAAGIGMVLPEAHVAAVRAHYHQPPESLYNAIADVARGTAWRSGLDSVQILSQPGQPLRWREYADWGAITFAQDEAEPARRVVTRIADESAGFGGGWTYEIAPAVNGSVVTITERGEVHSALFRFMSRYVFGHYRSLETYARDLGRRFSEDAEPERVGGH